MEPVFISYKNGKALIKLALDEQGSSPSLATKDFPITGSLN